MEVICPKCRKQLQASGSEGTRVICPHCRVTITLAATQRRPLATLEDPMFTPSGPTFEPSVVTTRMSVKACPYCGEMILAAAKKCKHCGEFLDGLTRQATQPAPLYARGGGNSNYAAIQRRARKGDRFTGLGFSRAYCFRSHNRHHSDSPGVFSKE